MACRPQKLSANRVSASGLRTSKEQENMAEGDSGEHGGHTGKGGACDGASLCRMGGEWNTDFTSLLLNLQPSMHTVLTG